MKKLFLGILFSLSLIAAIVWVLQSEHAVLMHPKGLIARSELSLIQTNLMLMVMIVGPTLAALFFVVWKYREKTAAKHEPERTSRVRDELIIWTLPSIVVAVMAYVTWGATHALDPYKPIASEQKPLQIQVVALDWKWLFIYPEQGIATVNFVQFPEKIPVQFALTADGSPMNSFWIPALAGQIYAMSGMVTPLHVMADGPGIYSGRAAEINGRGFADMTFTAKSCSTDDFNNWVSSVKQSPLQLTNSAYQELTTPSVNNPVALYSQVEKNLFSWVSSEN